MKKGNLSQQMILVIFTFQFLLAGCYNYYKATSPLYNNETDKATRLDSLKRAGRDFILRSEGKAFYMTNATISTDKKTLECILDTLTEYNMLHLTKGRNGKMQYKDSEPADQSVLNEVHLYVAPDTATMPGKYTLAVDKVRKIEVIEKDKRRTKDSYILGGTIIAAGILFVVLLLSVGSWDFGEGGR